MTEIAYRPLTEAEMIFKHLIWDPCVKGGETYLETAVPFFDFPVVKQIEEGVLNSISDWMFRNFVLLIDLEAIRLVNDHFQSAYMDASLKLKVMAHDHGMDSPEFKEARDVAQKALSQFSHLGP